MSEDLISRDAVLDACSQSINILDAMSRIEDLPSVTPKQRTGHWIDTDSDDAYWYMCSKCHRRTDEKSDYCPNCGCRMIEPQEKQCADCNHYGKLSLVCGRCDDNCSMYEPQESEEV